MPRDTTTSSRLARPAVALRPAPGRLRLRPSLVLAVFGGGCVGGLGRYEVGLALPTPAHGFPASTTLVNLTGAFLLALLLVLVTDVLPPTTYLRPLLGTGFCGAWTTFSSVVTDVDRLVAHGHAGTALGYLAANALGGLAAAALGLAAGRAAEFHWGRHRHPGGA